MLKVGKEIISMVQKRVLPKLIQLADNYQEVKWFPIIQYNLEGYFMGITDKGYWSVETKNGFVLLDAPQKYFFVMVLLEKTYSEICIKLIEFGNKDDKVNLISVFPFLYIVKIGLQQESNYWVELSFNWLSELPIDQKYLLQDIINNLKDAKWSSQRVKQKAQKELSNMRIIN